MAKISVVINTLNAERLLEKCLLSIQDADEIIICDMYSEDRTIEIARKFNCKIVYHQKTGIVEPARNWAMDQAAGEWILVLDADEMVTPELWQKLKSYAADPIPGYYACALTRETVIMAKYYGPGVRINAKDSGKKALAPTATEFMKCPLRTPVRTM